LGAWTRRRTRARCARGVSLSADGRRDTEIAERLGIRRNTASGCTCWRRRAAMVTPRSRGSSSARGGSCRSLRRGALAVREARARDRRGDRRRRHDGCWRRESQRDRRLGAGRAQDLEKGRRSTPPRTSFMATPAAMCCLSSSAPGTAAGRGCARQSANWRTSRASGLGGFRASAPRGSRRPSGAWTRSSGPPAARQPRLGANP
jgi:hypothetical protein